MGWTPAEVDRCTPFEFLAALEGWKRTNGFEDEGPAAPSAAEHDELVAKYAHV